MQFARDDADLARTDYARTLGGWAPELQKSRVYEQILMDVVLGALAPGLRLDEQALAARYNAGLAGVRDALGRLALEGLVVRRPRSGTSVALIDLAEVRETYDARRLIEPQCAAQAALRATLGDIEALRRTFDGAAAAVQAADARALVAMDYRFHGTLACASRNPTLARMVMPLQYKASRFWVIGMMRDTSAEDWRADVARHLAVVDCIEARDAQGARETMLEALGHFEEAERAPTPAAR